MNLNVRTLNFVPLPIEVDQMVQRINLAFSECRWRPHPQYSVFTQYDKEFYLSMKDAFVKKYMAFWSVARACMPKSVTELGCNAGSAMDAFLDAAGKDTPYIGYDLFGLAPTWGEYNPWDYLHRLAQDRGYTKVQAIKQNLRELKTIAPCDFAFVDGAHDYVNERADMELAFTANPRWIYVDDYDGADCKRAVSDACLAHLAQVDWQIILVHCCGSILIKLKQPTA